MLRPYEMPWRRPLEAAAAAGWMFAAALFHVLMAYALPPRASHVLVLLSLLMAVLRCRQALRILRIRAALSGRAMEMIPVSRLASMTEDPEQVVFGLGFIWQPLHSQRLYEMIKIDYRVMTLPAWSVRALGYQPDPQPDGEIGLPWIHGVEPH